MGVTNLLSLVFGVIFIYFMLSLVCNSVFEAISAWKGYRSQNLTHWVQKTFPGIYPLLLTNTLLDGLSVNGESTSYMSSANFTTALLGIIARYWQQIPANINEVEQALTDFKEHEANQFTSTRSIIPGDFNRALLTFINEARIATKDEAEQMKLLRTKIENWFDSMMDRITGNYKRKSIWGTFLIATFMVGIGNVDSIAIVKYLSTNTTALNELTTAADNAIKDPRIKQEMDVISAASKEGGINLAKAESLDSLIQLTQKNLADISARNAQIASFVPIGWQNAEILVGDPCWREILARIISKFVGLCITILAVSLGAPFWYNLLVKISDIRSSIKPLTAAATAEKKQKAKK